MSLKALMSKLSLKEQVPLSVSEYDVFVRQRPHEITIQEWARARKAWIEFENTRHKRRQSWEEITGWRGWRSMKNPHNGQYETRVTPEVYQLMQLCLSPHSHTLLKAWWIQKYNTRKHKHGNHPVA